MEASNYKTVFHNQRKYKKKNLGELQKFLTWAISSDGILIHFLNEILCFSSFLNYDRKKSTKNVMFIYMEVHSQIYLSKRDFLYYSFFLPLSHCMEIEALCILCDNIFLPSETIKIDSLLIKITLYLGLKDKIKLPPTPKTYNTLIYSASSARTRVTQGKFNLFTQKVMYAKREKQFRRTMYATVYNVSGSQMFIL